MLDVNYEPLESARADVRLVQSLNIVWQEERERRTADRLATKHDATLRAKVRAKVPAGKHRPSI